MQRRVGQRNRVMAMLWSGFLALWHDRTRRPALPLLLASLLLLMPPMPARAACSCDNEAHHQEMAAHHQEEHSHGKSDFHAHFTPDEPVAVSSAGQPVSHAHLDGPSQSAGVVTACCSCPRAPLSAPVLAPSAPPNIHADAQALVYVRASALPVYRLDALTGLFGRAGPLPESKPKPLFLASLSGRAPPVSL